MKTTNAILFTAAVAATLTALSVRAQYRATGDDGVTASPKTRQMLDERRAVQPPTLFVPVTVSVKPGLEGIAASPKVLQTLGAQRVIVSAAPYAEVVRSGYEPNAPDGIAASPKVRQQMGQRQTEFIIAPIK